MTYHHRIARELKNTKNFFLNWPANSPLRLGDYGFYNGKHVEFDWQGNLSNFGIKLEPGTQKGRGSESYRSAGNVSVMFDLASDTPASATLSFKRKHSVAFETHDTTIASLEKDPLLLQILEKLRDDKIKWNPHWVVVTSIYRATSFSSFVSGYRYAKANVIAKDIDPTSTFALANPSIGLDIGFENGMAMTSLARSATPYFKVSKIKGLDPEGYRLEEYGKS